MGPHDDLMLNWHRFVKNNLIPYIDEFIPGNISRIKLALDIREFTVFIESLPKYDPNLNEGKNEK